MLDCIGIFSVIVIRRKFILYINIAENLFYKSAWCSLFKLSQLSYIYSIIILYNNYSCVNFLDTIVNGIFIYAMTEFFLN